MHWWQLPTCIPGIVEECLPFLDQRILSEKVSSKSKLKFEPENVRTGAAFSGLHQPIFQMYNGWTDGRMDPVSGRYLVHTLNKMRLL